MKSLFFVPILVVLFCACKSGGSNKVELPFVIDSADVFTPSQMANLKKLYADYDARTHNKVNLLMIRDYSPKKNLHEYGIKYFDEKGLDADSSHYNVLILFCAGRHDIEILSNRASEPSITNNSMHSVIHDVMIPCFRKSRDYEGIWKGSESIFTLLEAASK